MSGRLEQILKTGGNKVNHISGYTETDLTPEDIGWLIEQAERVEKAEKLISKLHRGLGMSVVIDRQLWLETDRYMKALEEQK